jgi:hypothetical protein
VSVSVCMFVRLCATRVHACELVCMDMGVCLCVDLHGSLPFQHECLF